MEKVGVILVIKSWVLDLVKKILSLYSSPTAKEKRLANCASVFSHKICNTRIINAKLLNEHSATTSGIRLLSKDPIRLPKFANNILWYLGPFQNDFQEKSAFWLKLYLRRDQDNQRSERPHNNPRMSERMLKHPSGNPRRWFHAASSAVHANQSIQNKRQEENSRKIDGQTING